jgi:flagellar hook-associated protein 2
VAIQLNDGTQDLLNTVTAGSLAQYQVNGQPSTPISSNTDTITLAPGLTANLLGTGDTTVNVAADSSAASSAISSFVTAYNAVANELDNNHGVTGGALTGQSIVLSLRQSLQDLTGFSGGSGSATNLADLGLTFNSTGQLSFDQTQFSNLESSDPSDVATFLGSAASGSGFLNSATNILNSLVAPTTGVFASAENTVQNQITSDNQQITTAQSQVEAVQKQMTAQMAAADSLISSLQAQSTYFTNYFAAEQNVQNSIAND